MSRGGVIDDRSLEERTPAVHERRPSDRHPSRSAPARTLPRAHRRLGANSRGTRRYRDHPVLSGCVPRLDGKEVVRCLQEIHGWTMQ